MANFHHFGRWVYTDCMADNQSQPSSQDVQTPASDQSAIQPEPISPSSAPVQPEATSTSSAPLPSAEVPHPPQEETWPNSTNVAIPLLQLPFNGEYPVSLAFGANPSDEVVKKKFKEWGVVGHHGIDFKLPEGTEVVAVSDGKVIQAGDNGDFGITVIIQHPWGTSLYAHLKETKVSQDAEVKAKDIIGISGQTGVTFGPHLHFGIKPMSLDQTNGHLGFIDPSPYLPALTVQKEESKPEVQPQVSSPPSQPQTSQIPQTPQASQPQVVEREVVKEVIKEVPVEVIKEVVKEVPVLNQEEVQKQVEEKLKVSLDEKRKLANEERKKRKTENLQKIMEFAKVKRTITNDDIRDLLHVSQSTATNYLSELVNQGMLKKQGEREGTKYTY